MRQASLKVPVLIAEDNKRRDVDMSLGADFLTLANASWDRHNRMLTLYVPPGSYCTVGALVWVADARNPIWSYP